MARTLRTYDLNKAHELLARDWAAANGYVGRAGGWIYGDVAGLELPLCQGYGKLWDKRRVQILDALTRELAAFTTFQAMLDCTGYSPRRYSPQDWRVLVLAIEFNRAQETREDSRRFIIEGIPADLPKSWRDSLPGSIPVAKG